MTVRAEAKPVEPRVVARDPAETGAPGGLLAPVAITFGPPNQQLFGFHHAPDASIARGVGVVLCNPLGKEAMSTHRAYRHLAEHLAAAGVHALRFDYHGTGDSAGSADEPGRVRAWLDSIGAAIDELRMISGAQLVDLVGIRFGATLAALVADERRDVRSLVLWAPCASGRTYVRELRALRMIKGVDVNECTGPAPEGDEEVAGYVFAASTIKDLSALDLISRREPIASRVLIVPRDDLPTGERRIANHLSSLGIDVTFHAVPGYAGMMREPEESIVPLATLETIVNWIRTPCSPVAAVSPRQRTSAPDLMARSGRSRQLVREVPHQFGEGGRLFGILTEPIAETQDPARPAIVFLNVGANHHIGPNRMYVSLARDFAALGYLAFRFDVAGLGDSVAAAGSEHKIYSRESARDVEAAVSLLASVRGVRRVVLVGVCSGAYIAFHAGLSDERVAGEILINPQTFDWKDDDTLEVSARKSFRSTRYYLNALTKRKVWAQALRGKVDTRSVIGVLRERLAARLGAGLEEALGRFSGELLPRSEIARAFHTMSDRGVQSLLVFSSNDGGLDMIERHLGRDAKKIDRKNVRLAIIEDADHTFTLLRWQTELATLMTSFIEDAFP